MVGECSFWLFQNSSFFRISFFIHYHTGGFVPVVYICRLIIFMIPSLVHQYINRLLDVHAIWKICGMIEYGRVFYLANIMRKHKTPAEGSTVRSK